MSLKQKQKLKDNNRNFTGGKKSEKDKEINGINVCTDYMFGSNCSGYCGNISGFSGAGSRKASESFGCRRLRH